MDPVYRSNAESIKHNELYVDEQQRLPDIPNGTHSLQRCWDALVKLVTHIVLCGVMALCGTLKGAITQKSTTWIIIATETLDFF